MTIRPATYTEIREIKSDFVGHNPRSSYLAAFDGERAVGCVGWRMIRPGTIELCGDVVLPEYRKRGIYTALSRAREAVLASIPHSREVAYCTRWSYARYISAGFQPKREYKYSIQMEKLV